MTCYSTSCIVLLHDSYILESCMKCRIFSMLAHIESQSVNQVFALVQYYRRISASSIFIQSRVMEIACKPLAVRNRKFSFNSRGAGQPERTLQLPLCSRLLQGIMELEVLERQEAKKSQNMYSMNKVKHEERKDFSSPHQETNM